MSTYTLQPAKHYRAKFDGSDRLFRACWRQYCNWLRGSIDDPTSDDDVHSWLEIIATERVNDSRSVFYIYG